MSKTWAAGRIRYIAANIEFHPILFALSPVLFLVASNQPEFSWLQVARSFVFSMLLASLLVGLARTILPHRHAAPLLATTIILAVFSYGHIYRLTEDVVLGEVVIGRHRHLLPLLAGLITFVFLRLRSINEGDAQALTVWANAAGLVAIGIQVVTLVTYSLSGPVEVRRITESTFGGKPIQASGAPQPDIYYIIVDGYARQDILQQVYGYDNRPFLDWLKDKGFFVAERSHANYLNTDKSLATSLNMTYLHTLQDHHGFSFDAIPVGELISDSEVRSQLESAGYRTATFSTGFWPTDVSDSDVYIRVGDSPHFPIALIAAPGLNRFESLLLETTAYRAVKDLKEGLSIQDTSFEHTYAQERERVHTIFSTLAKIPSWPDKYFVFAHVIPPHPPFIFGPTGEPLTPSYAYNLADHADFLKFGTREEYMEGYLGQLQYLNHLLKLTIEEIIESSPEPPIIIIQSDHGPGAYYRYDSLEETYLPERASILNAYFVPDNVRAWLYPSITPVNSFRMIFKHAFGLDLKLLPDQTYFYPYSDRPADPSLLSIEQSPPDNKMSDD